MSGTEVAELVTQVLQGLALGIIPDRVYSPAEAAELLGHRGERAAQTLRELPADVLPYITLRPGGKRKGYYGRDMLRYIAEQRTAK